MAGTAMTDAEAEGLLVELNCSVEPELESRDLGESLPPTHCRDDDPHSIQRVVVATRSRGHIGEPSPVTAFRASRRSHCCR